MRISDWSSDVCSSDLRGAVRTPPTYGSALKLIDDPRRRKDDRDTDDDRDERACVDATCQPLEARRNQRKDRNDAQEPVAQQIEDRIAEALQIGLCARWFGVEGKSEVSRVGEEGGRKGKCR